MSDELTSTGGSTATTTSTGGDSGASGGGASSVTSDSRPATFQDAFRAVGASDTPDPGYDAPDPSAPAPATEEPVSTAPAEPVVDATGQPAKGPIPFERHEAILANTREKTAREIVSQVEQRFGGAITLQRQMQADPAGTISQLIEEAVNHPELGQQVISTLARTLAARRKPGADLTPVDTEVGPLYTADQVKTLVEQTLAQRMAPIEQEREAARRHEDALRMKEQTAQTVRSRLAQWESQPGFSEHKAEIAAKQKEFVKQGADTWTALGLAYAAVVPTKLQAKQTTQFVQDAVRKANASTSNPATVAPTMKPRPKSFSEAFAQLRRA